MSKIIDEIDAGETDGSNQPESRQTLVTAFSLTSIEQQERARQFSKETHENLRS